MNYDQDIKLATQLVRDYQQETGRELSNEGRRNLLIQTGWKTDYIRRVVGDLGDCE